MQLSPKYIVWRESSFPPNLYNGGGGYNVSTTHMATTATWFLQHLMHECCAGYLI